MIRGAVNAHSEAIVPLRLRGPGGAELEIDALVDTGYTGIFILPPETIIALGLAQQTTSIVLLGDGTPRRTDVYAVEIEWGGVWRAVSVTELEGAPLIGTRLLAGHEVFIEFVPGGVVDITAIP